MRRLSRREQLKEEVRNLDVFPKVEPEVQQRTPSGALATLLSTAVILVLVISEFYYYRTVDVSYEYTVDKDINRPMNFTLDITVNMPCQFLGADHIDVAGKSKDATLWFIPEPAFFELAPNQQDWMRRIAATRDQEGAHGLDSLQRFLHGRTREPMPPADPPLTGTPSACRFHGLMPVDKVAANFHITAGKSVHHARGHSHMVGMLPPEAMNFSHRIDQLSFAENAAGPHTLDGDMKIADNRNQMYQYFLKVVPTSTQRVGQPRPTFSNQYSVTEESRAIDNLYGGNGMPGIFVKFDMEPVGVVVKETRRSLVAFLVSLCAIVGGIFATSGMLHQLLSGAMSISQPEPSLPSTPH